MEKQKKKNSLKVHKKEKETKRKQEDIEKNVDYEKEAEIVESANRKKTKVEKKLKEDLSKPDKVKELKQISDDLSKPDKLKKKKRKKSLELAGNGEHVSTNVDQEPVKKKKKSKTESGHVSEQTSPKQLSVIASDNSPSEDSETDKTEKDSSQRKKKKKKKQKEDIPDLLTEGELDNSEQDTVVPKKKKKKKNKEKEEEDKPSGSEDTSISAQTAAINYLKTWSEDIASWKFQKVRQVWLLQHLYDESKVPNTDFDRLLLYLENLKGKAKEETLLKASKVIEAEDSSSDEGNNEGGKTMRARQLMQMLN
ncbi:uncharacterized protein C7orf50 homolog [Mizuhopecten yessoensis]|uniref:uncharacterized protein C7orf50 homolog n=1 Tax=Mizuhopecten yessoensis TaxID=6573 RepID=UPI000B4578D6|nr:uncharacterized protein C7orf50 homolog [Mizuhopecten yessoensis]